MSIPDLNDQGVLPAGIHDCTWDELFARFGSTRHRRQLLAGLRSALIALKNAGCANAYIDGSFVTDKRVPGDFDGCWDPTGVDLGKLDPVLLDFDNSRANQKAKYRGELFPAHLIAEPQHRIRFLEFFQQTRTGDPKGILSIDLTQEFS